MNVKVTAREDGCIVIEMSWENGEKDQLILKRDDAIILMEKLEDHLDGT